MPVTAECQPHFQLFRSLIQTRVFQTCRTAHETRIPRAREAPIFAHTTQGRARPRCPFRIPPNRHCDEFYCGASLLVCEHHCLSAMAPHQSLGKIVATDPMAHPEKENHITKRVALTVALIATAFLTSGCFAGGSNLPTSGLYGSVGGAVGGAVAGATAGAPDRPTPPPLSICAESRPYVTVMFHLVLYDSVLFT